MSKLFIPVGIPGCGKSTFANHLLRPSQSVVVSTDAIRADFVTIGKLADVGDMSLNSEIFDIYHERINACLKTGWDVVADATNLRDFAREKLRAIAAEHNAETHLLVFTNLSAAVQRNAKRDRVVPPEAMVGMLGQYEKALKDIPQETYTSVTYIEGTA